jgi:hypothetical protein
MFAVPALFAHIDRAIENQRNVTSDTELLYTIRLKRLLLMSIFSGTSSKSSKGGGTLSGVFERAHEALAALDSDGLTAVCADGFLLEDTSL